MPFVELEGDGVISYDTAGSLLALPAVAAPPAGVTYRAMYHVALIMPRSPNLDSFGWPLIDPTSSTPSASNYRVTEEGPNEWGGLQVVINQTDVTFYRGVPMQVNDWSFSEPFADEQASLKFPQISPFEVEPSFLGSWNNVEIVVYNGEVLWEGFINALSWDENGVSVDCMGVLRQGDLYVRAPGFFNNLIPISILLRDYAFNQTYRPAYRFATLAIEDGTPTQSRYRGSWESPLAFAQRLLEQATDEDGAFSIRIVRPRTPVLMRRDTTTQHWSVSVGQPGVRISLRADFIQEFNVLYAEGEDYGGATWRGVFRDPTNGMPRIQPVAYDPAVHGFDEVEEVIVPGELLGSLRYDAARATSTQIRIEQYHNVGSNYSRADAKSRGAESILRSADTGYAGSIELASDPEEDIRFRMKAGQNILLRNFHGEGGDGMMFHISGCRQNFSSGTVSLTVDSKARDLATIEAILGHFPEAYDPYLAISDGRSAALINDRTFPWDDAAGSGNFPGDDTAGYVHADPTARITVPGRTWTQAGFLASEKDTIVKSEFYANEDEDGDPVTRRFHVSVFNREPVMAQLPALPLDPDVWNELPRPDGHQFGWGYEGGEGAQAAGYTPGLESLGSPETGVLIDYSTWQYDHADVDPEVAQVGFLWVVIWIDHDDTTLFHGVLTRGVGTT